MTSEQMTARTNSKGQIGKSTSKNFIIASWNTNSVMPSRIATIPCGVRLAGATGVVITVLNFTPWFGAPKQRAAKRGSY
jgi:hypothetical protein